MLYTRAELVELVRQQPAHLHAILVALAWFVSHADPNLVSVNGSNERYGLLQVDLLQARQAGFRGEPNQLLDPKVNIPIGAQLIESLGLIQYCGREFATQIPAILRLEQSLSENYSPIAVAPDDVAKNKRPSG